MLGAILGDGWYAGFVGFDPRGRATTTAASPSCCASCTSSTPTAAARSSPPTSAGRRRPARSCTPTCSWASATTRAASSARGTPVDRTTARRHPARARARAADPGDRGAAPGRRHASARPGVHVFDLGQNMVGWVAAGRQGRARRRASGCASPRCSSPTARSTSTTCAARASSTPTCSRGDGDEVFEPRFTFHGFRYVEVDRPRRQLAQRSPAASSTPTRRAAGWFECSDELVNQLWRNIIWGQRGNFISVPTDCPQRDERLGWLADAQVFLPTAALQHGRRRVHHQVGRRRARRPVARRRVPRRRAAAASLERDGAPAWARRGGHRAVGHLAPLRRPPPARAPLAGDGALHGLSAAPQPRPAVDGAARQRLRRLAVGRRATRRATSSPPPTGPTTPR